MLASRLLPRLRRWAAGRLPARARDMVDTEDLVQETVSNVLRRIDEFEPRHEAALTIYLRQALMNRLRNEIRRAVRHPAGEALDLVSEHPSSEPTPLEAAVSREALDRYEAALATLDLEDRQIVIGRLEFHYSYQELADAWRRPSADAVRKTVERAVKRLAMVMADVQ